jgi:hypothetical protein
MHLHAVALLLYNCCGDAEHAAPLLTCCRCRFARLSVPELLEAAISFFSAPAAPVLKESISAAAWKGLRFGILLPCIMNVHEVLLSAFEATRNDGSGICKRSYSTCHKGSNQEQQLLQRKGRQKVLDVAPIEKSVQNAAAYICGASASVLPLLLSMSGNAAVAVALLDGLANSTFATAKRSRPSYMI